jgi:hypothetical protein
VTPIRTTARGLLVLTLLAFTGVSANAQIGAAKVPQLVFPVVGKAVYTDDFGAPRGTGAHEGNDIMTTWRSPAVAVEPGTVKFHTTSARAGCMLYLHGASGTTYIYIHLNNDLTAKNDNRGKCVAGVAYAKGLKSGDTVVAGQPVGYVGDSGDAEGIAPHLHFEMHPGGKASINPYPHLKKARRLLFAAPPKAVVSLALTGSLVATLPAKVQVKVDSLRVSTGLRVPRVGRVLRMRLPDTAFVEWVGGIPIAVARLTTLKKGQPLTAFTVEDFVTLDAQLGKPDVLEISRILLAKA